MSIIVSSLRDALSVNPSTKVPIGVTALVLYVIPPVVSYVAMAVLAITPQTRIIRIALWPVVALLAFRATVSLDMALGDPDRIFLNVLFMFFMLSIAARTFCWTLEKNPLVRHLRPTNIPPSTIMDALDLVTNLRGHCWNWSRGLYVPRETRPTNRIAFGFYTLLSAVGNALICGVLHQTIRTLAANTRSSPNGLSMFDDTLPFFVRYLRAGIITTLAGVVTQIGTQLNYDIVTVPCILIFGQDPTRWPPAFDNPWRATSLCDFWGRRWHQFFRQIFLLGSYPLTAVFGRAGGIIGTFLASALCHHVMMVTLGSPSEGWRMLVAFGMMGPGVLAERAFYKMTARKVGGIVGWVWTMSWLLLLGTVMVEGFLKGGMFAPSPSTIPGPLLMFVENLVTGFDAWLHTI